ncbi:DMT family transporter [Rhizobium setariae]|nr:DMT family transporter [Rhizobium setariae]
MQFGSANKAAALIALMSFAIFTGADASVKLLSDRFSVFQVTFVLTSYAVLFIAAWALIAGKAAAIVPKAPLFASVRGILLATETLLIYYAFSTVPLAEAYVIAFLAPIMVAVLAVIFLGERMSMWGALGVALGFAGVLVVMQPGRSEIALGHVAAIFSALIFSITLLMLRRTKAHEDDLALAAVPLVILALMAGCFLPWAGGFPALDLKDLLIFMLGGFCLFLGHTLLVKAFRVGEASVVAPFQYSQIIWGSAFGLVLFGSPIELTTMLGAAIIILSGWLVLR